MAIERIVKQKAPTLFDRIIESVQGTLGESLPWLDHIFGRAERLVKEVDGYKRYTPNVYLGRNEYIGLLPDDRLGNFVFFTVDDPQTVQWARGERNRLTAPFSLILWCDMRTVEEGDERSRERIKSAVLRVLNGGLSLRNGHLKVTAVYERAENVYNGFTIDEVKNQFLMSPYAGYRFEGTMMIEEDCV